MARGVSIKGGNLTMKAPAGEEDRVNDLHVFRNRGCVITAWQFSLEELLEIKRTGRIYIAFWGQGMPPTLVGCEDAIREATAEGGVLPRQEDDHGST